MSERGEVDFDPGIQGGGRIGEGKRELLWKRQVGLPFPNRSETLRAGRCESSILPMAVCSKRLSWSLAGLLLGSVLVASGCGGGTKEPADAFFEPSATAPLSPAVSTPTTSPRVTAVGGNTGLEAAREVFREGRYEEAAAMYAAVAAVSSGSVRADALIGSSTARYSNGDAEGALRAIEEAVQAAPEDSAESVSAGYLLGIRLQEAGRYEDGVIVLARVMSRASALAPYIRFEYGRGLAAAGRGAEAATAWDGLLAEAGLPPGLRIQVLRERARIARMSGDLVEFVRWLDALIALNGDPSSAYTRARMATAAGDGALSQRLLTSLVALQPESTLAVQAVALLHEAGVTVDAGQEGLIYYRRGAYQDARRVLLVGIDEPGIGAAALAFRLYYLAASYEDAGITDKAITYYDRAAAVGGSALYTHRAKYWAARVTERSGNVAGAGARYRALVTEGPSGEFTAEAAFRAGYTLLESGDATGAVAAWDAVGGGGGARVAYWKGRALARLGRTAEAASEYQRAVGFGALDFYGGEAARELRSQGPIDTEYQKRDLSGVANWDAIAAWLSVRIAGSWPGSAPTAAGELVAVGLGGWAAGVVNDAAAGAGAWRLLELAREAHSAGMMDVAAQLAVRVRMAAGVESADVPRELLRVIYPVDYVTRLNAEAEANGIDPLFLAALIRQESFWDPGAGSSAGALGLTQVIPATGEGIARALDVQGFAPDDLYRPAVSLRFGAYYLGGQVRRFGRPWAALAAYNAGPGNASRWLEATGSGGAAEFVEEVDFDETAHYVTNVLEHYAHYLRAYAE